MTIAFGFGELKSRSYVKVKVVKCPKTAIWGAFMGVFELDEQNVMSTATTERGQACGVARQHAVPRETACKTPNHHFGAEVADGDEDACDRDHGEHANCLVPRRTARRRAATADPAERAPAAIN